MEKNIWVKASDRMILKVEGRSVEKFLKRLIVNKIELLKVYSLKRQELRIEIFKKDFEKVQELKTIYEITVLQELGPERFKKKIFSNAWLFFSLILCGIFLVLLSNIMFEVEVVYNDKSVRNFIKKELKEYGIYEKTWKKSYSEIAQIKEQILEKNKTKLEWLEIERSGVRYIVRLEERKLQDAKKSYPKQHVVAKKDAVIKKIHAEKGMIVKNVNDYVKKGDILISGSISLNETVKENVAALGTVYGEVWYTVTVDYPLIYEERNETGKRRTTYSIQFLNHKFDLLPFHQFKTFNTNEKVLLKNSWIPFSFLKEKQKEVNLISEILTEEQAIKKALLKAKTQMESQLNDKEEIKYEKCLKVERKDSKIEVEVFFTVLEDITDTIEIVELEEEE